MKDKDIKNSFTKVCGVAYAWCDIKRIINFCIKHNYNWYYIKHNDFEENINEIKLHYHFIIESSSKHRFNIKSLLTDTFKINLFEKCDNVGKYLRYMVHIDYDAKKHYDFEKIHSNIGLEKITQLIDNCDKSKTDITENNFQEVLLYLFQCFDSDKTIKLRDIIQYCLDNDINFKSSWTFTINSLINDKLKADKEKENIELHKFIKRY